MEKITTVGIDLAKNVFSLHGVDANGKVVLKRTVRRAELLPANERGLGIRLSSGPERTIAHQQAAYSDAVPTVSLQPCSSGEVLMV